MTRVSADEEEGDDEAEALKQDYVDEAVGESSTSLGRRRSAAPSPLRGDLDDGAESDGGAILTTTTLNYLRLVGRYIEMMDVLKPIAVDVLIGISQIFDYYLYAVYNFFGRPPTDVGSADDKTTPSALHDASLPSKLRATLLRLCETMEKFETHQELAAQGGIPRAVQDQLGLVGFAPPRLSSLVQLNDASRLYGLPECVTAIESLMFLHDSFTALRVRARGARGGGRERGRRTGRACLQRRSGRLMQRPCAG